MTRHARRPGLSLTEVLVALFVMAIGLIGILTLFPVGAVSMGQALRDDRCSETALQADGFLRAYWQQHVVENPGMGDPFVWAMDDPNELLHQPEPSMNTGKDGVFKNRYHVAAQRLPSSYTPPSLSAVGEVGSTGDGMHTPPTDPEFWVERTGTPSANGSYPVLIDPLGFLARTGSDQVWVGGNAASATTLRVPRRNLSAIGSGLTAIRTCSLLDDLTFVPNGAPPSGDVTRGGRYNWAAMLRRTDAGRRNQASMWILCFDGRPPLSNVPDSEIVVSALKPDWTIPLPAETALVQDSRTVRAELPVPSDAAAPPIIRRGGWVMDGTLTSTGVRHAHFYRIVGATQSDSSNPRRYELDIDPPIREGVLGESSLYFFAGLAEVFERPPLVPLQ